MADETQIIGPVAEPLGQGVKNTILPALPYLAKILGCNELDEATILEPSRDRKWRGRPTIDISFLGYPFRERVKPEDKKTGKPEERKTGLSYLDKGADVGGRTLSLDELYKFIEGKGIKVEEKPYRWLQNRFGKYIGYRDGKTIYVADHLSPETKKATAMHELFEDPYQPHEKCQSKALEFARSVDLSTYEVLRKMGRTIGLN